MRKSAVLALMFVLFIAGFHILIVESRAADTPPAEGAVLPDIKLPAIEKSEDIQYLGIKGDAPFKIPQVQAEVVIVEIFSMYCPYCQREAPLLNELYRLIAARPDLKDKIKILGIGAGNHPYEVNLFRTKYQVLFPIFPDGDYSLHTALGQVRTPYFIGIRINPDGSHKVIYSKVGSIGNAQDFIELLLKRSKPA